MDVPPELRFSTDHLWLRQQREGFRVGVSDFAQGELGDVVFVDLPRAGTALVAGACFGWLESTKVVVDLNAPIDGTVVEANERLGASPELVNRDPYGQGWLCTIAARSVDEVERLLDADAYRALLQQIASERAP